MVPPDSHQVSRARCYSGYRWLQFLQATGLSPSMARPFQTRSLEVASSVCGPTTPGTPKCSRFGLFRVRSPLLTEYRLISFPVGTEMCHFPTLAEHPPIEFRGRRSRLPETRLSHSGILGSACVQLPEAYRSLPRPSSPLSAKTSTIHP